jgi:hypothetical protein
MDFMDLNEKAREAELDQREVMSLLRFCNFRRERNGEARIDSDYNYNRIFDRLEEAYPDLSFRRVDHRIFVSVKPRSKGSLVEKISFVSKQIPHLAMNGVYGFDGVCVVFRADGVGVIKEGSWYEFFEHELDLEKIKRECGNDHGATSDRLRDYFRSGISRFMKDPFFDPSAEERDLYFEQGSQEELDRLMRLFILTEPGIDKHVDSQVCLFAGVEGRDPHLEDRRAYCSKRLKKLAEIALSENRPVGWSFEYNDGAHYRRSGYDRHPTSITWGIGEIVEQTTAREKMAARRELRKYLKSRGHDPARLDTKARRAIYHASKHTNGRQALRKR